MAKIEHKAKVDLGKPGIDFQRLFRVEEILREQGFDDFGVTYESGDGTVETENVAEAYGESTRSRSEIENVFLHERRTGDKKDAQGLRLSCSVYMSSHLWVRPAVTFSGPQEAEVRGLASVLERALARGEEQPPHL